MKTLHLFYLTTTYINRGRGQKRQLCYNLHSHNHRSIQIHTNISTLTGAKSKISRSRYYRNNILSLTERAMSRSTSNSSTSSTSSTSRPPLEIPWVQCLATKAIAPTNTDTDTFIAKKTKTKQTSIFSWNILAQHLFDSTPKWYTHISPDDPVVHKWNKRWNLILNEISSSQADVICLQEVEFAAFNNDILPSLQSLGYAGTVQNSKSRKRGHGYGVATFWRSNRFRLRDVSHHSRTMLTTLEDCCSNDTNDANDNNIHSRNNNNNNEILAVLNCHLEGNPSKSVIRVRQLQNSLKELKQKYTHHQVVICGDFNCQLGQSPCSTYLHYGSCPKHIHCTEFGRPLDEDQINELDKNIQQHGYNFFSAYPIELMTRDPLEYITFVNGPGSFTVGLDQIWFHSENKNVGAGINVVGLRSPFHSPEHKQQVLKNGLPNKYHPSDHMPVGCILEWDVDTDCNSRDLRSSDKIGFTDSTSSEGGRGLFEEDRNEGDVLQEISELLAACPFSAEEQRKDFEFVISPVQGMPLERGMRPTSEQILQVQQRRKVKKKLWEDVSDDAREMLERIIVLTKEASKFSK